MKILYVITGLSLGGAEKVVVGLADKMVQLGHQVKIAYLTGEVKVRPQTPEIEVIYLGLESWGSFISACRRYWDVIRNYEPDIVHAHMVHANIFTRLNRLVCHVPKLICSAHSSNEGGRIRMLAYKYTNFLSNYNTNVSQSAVDAFVDSGCFIRENIHAVYNGIDLNRFKMSIDKHAYTSFSPSEVNFLSVGRLADAKDYPNLIRAIYLVKKQTNKNVRFYIVGEGTVRLEIEGMIQQLDLFGQVTLLGARSDIPELLNQADFFILSSKYEGLSTVLIEAMACQCFVITTDCGGSAEIIGDTGILVETENSEKLAEAIIKALELPEEYVYENNQRARKRAEEKFSLEKSIQVWLDIYEKK